LNNSGDFITNSDKFAVQQVNDFMSNFVYYSFVNYVTFSYVINGKKVFKSSIACE